MPIIKLDTIIVADIQTCFDASRSIDVHAGSMSETNEKAIGGRISGLITMNESVTWRARHFGIWWHLTSRITQMDNPNSFTDELVRGPFANMVHRHVFISMGTHTIMKDEFNYTSPLGLLGTLADWLFLEKHMRNLLRKRNDFIRRYCEKTR